MMTKICKLCMLALALVALVACKNKQQDDNLTVYANDQVSDEEKNILGINDIPLQDEPEKDTIIVSNNKLKVVKIIDHLCFKMNLDLPEQKDDNVNELMMKWINEHLDEKIPNMQTADNVEEKETDFDAFRKLYNLTFQGDVLDFMALANFYQEKYAKILQGHRGLVAYQINGSIVFESKDIVSYEISNELVYADEMKSYSNVRGATFFKYDGSILGWNYFVGTDVKNLVKQEVNNQSIKISQEEYERMLLKSKYREFSLPDNPPYATVEGLKFVYGKREWNPLKNERQISCVIPVEQFNLDEQLELMLK